MTLCIQCNAGTASIRGVSFSGFHPSGSPLYMKSSTVARRNACLNFATNLRNLYALEFKTNNHFPFNSVQFRSGSGLSARKLGFTLLGERLRISYLKALESRQIFLKVYTKINKSSKIELFSESNDQSYGQVIFRAIFEGQIRIRIQFFSQGLDSDPG